MRGRRLLSTRARVFMIALRSALSGSVASRSRRQVGLGERRELRGADAVAELARTLLRPPALLHQLSPVLALLEPGVATLACGRARGAPDVCGVCGSSGAPSASRPAPPIGAGSRDIRAAPCARAGNDGEPGTKWRSPTVRRRGARGALGSRKFSARGGSGSAVTAEAGARVAASRISRQAGVPQELCARDFRHDCLNGMLTRARR